MAVLLAGLALLAVAPLAMPDGYRWVEHGVSESAAQGVDGAWIARAGFVLFGLGALGTSAVRREAWGVAGATLHAVFGLSMLFVAAYSARSWDPAVAYVASEDALHSFFASAMGFAYVAGVISVSVTRVRRTSATWILDGLAVTTATLVPLLGLDTTWWGVAQRAMFVVAAAWFTREALAPA